MCCAAAARPSRARRAARRPSRSARRATSWAWIVSKLTCAREQEVVVVELGERVERALSASAHGVLDEARLQVRVLDDEELVGPLQQLVDRRAHRALDDRRRGPPRRARCSVPTKSVPRPRWLCVASGTSSRIRSTSSPRSRPRASRSAARSRTSPCAHGQALIPVASTPTTRRVPCVDAAAIPISETISCVARPVTGVRRWIGHARVIRDLGAERALALDDVARDVLGEHLDEQRLADHDVARSPPRRARGSATCARPSGRGEVDGAVDHRRP